MSADPGWMIDEGPDDPDEDFRYDEDLYEDDDSWRKEEPDCPDCWDRGCKSCYPTRFQAWRWQLRHRLTYRWRTWRRNRNWTPDEPPF